MELSAMAGTNILVRQKDLIAGSGISITPDTTSGNVTIAATNTAIDEARLLPTGGKNGNILEYQEGADRGNGNDVRLLLQSALTDSASGNAAPAAVTTQGVTLTGDNSLLFSGNDSHVTAVLATDEIFAADKEWTIDFWMKPIANSSEWNYILTETRGDWGSHSIGLTWNKTKNVLEQDTGGYVASVIKAPNWPNNSIACAVGEWHFVAVEKQKTATGWSLNYYLNGAIWLQVAFTGEFVPFTSDNPFWFGGKTTDSGRWFKGEANKLRVTAGARYGGKAFAVPDRLIDYAAPAGQPVWIEGIDRSRLLPENPASGDIPCYNATATTGGGNDENTRLLIQPSNSDHGIVDQAAGNAAPVTLENHNVTVDEEGNMVFDGSNSYLKIPANTLPSDFFNGTDEWTLDIVYNVASKSMQCLFGCSSSLRMDFLLNSGGTLQIGGGPNLGTGWPFNEDVHLTFEIYKDGTVWKYTIFRNGSVVTTGTWVNADWRSVAQYIGWEGESDSRKINGKIKALRLTSGALHKGAAFQSDYPWTKPQTVGEWGKFNKSELVQSVNGVAPNESGNVILDASTIIDNSRLLPVLDALPEGYEGSLLAVQRGDGKVADENTLRLMHFNDDVRDVVTDETGTLKGNASITPTGYFDGALSINHAVVSSLSFNGLTATPTAWTMDFRVKLGRFSGDAPIVMIGTNLNETQTSLIRVDSSYIDIQATYNQRVIYKTHSLQLDTWYHFALTYDGTTYKFYVDGKLFGSGESANQFDFTRKLWFGSFYDYSTSYVSDCTIDEFRLSNVVRWTENFTPPDAPYGESLYNWGIGPKLDESRLLPETGSVSSDSVGNPVIFKAISRIDNTYWLCLPLNEDTNDRSTYDVATGVYGTVNIVSNAPSSPGGSAFFNGSSCLHGTLPAQFGASDFTVRLWMMAPTISSSSHTIFSTRRGNQTDADTFGLLCTTEGRLFIYSNGDITSRTDTPFTLQSNVWYHVAVVRKSGVLTIYVNGEVYNSATFTNSLTRQIFGLGASWTGSSYSEAGTVYLTSLDVLNYAAYDEAFTTPAYQPGILAGAGYEVATDSEFKDMLSSAGIDESRLVPTGGKNGNLLEYQEGVDRGNNVNTKLLLQPATSDGLIVDQAAGNAAPVSITNSGNVVIEDNALVFTGTNSLLIPANALGMTLGGNNEFTIDIEFQLDSVKSDYATLYGSDGGGSGYQGALYFTSGGAAQFTMDLGPRTTGWTLGIKHRITIERWNDNGTWKTSVYRNGSFLASSTSGMNILSDYVFPIGSNTESTNRNFIGKIWAFRISNKAEHRGVSFTPRELPFLPPAGQPVWTEGIDRSRLLPENPANGDIPCYSNEPPEGVNYNDANTVLLLQGSSDNTAAAPTSERLNGIVTGEFPVQEDGSILVNGTSNYITFNDADTRRVFSGEFTLETYIKTTQFTASGKRQDTNWCVVYRNDTSSVTAYQWLLLSDFYADAGKFGIWPYPQMSGETFPKTLVNAEFQHVAIDVYMVDGVRKFTMYRNGVPYHTGNYWSTTPADWSSSVSAAMRLFGEGTSGGDDYLSNASVMSLRVSNIARYKGVSFDPPADGKYLNPPAGYWGKLNKSELVVNDARLLPDAPSDTTNSYWLNSGPVATQVSPASYAGSTDATWTMELSGAFEDGDISTLFDSDTTNGVSGTLGLETFGTVRWRRKDQVPYRIDRIVLRAQNSDIGAFPKTIHLSGYDKSAFGPAIVQEFNAPVWETESDTSTYATSVTRVCTLEVNAPAFQSYDYSIVLGSGSGLETTLQAFAAYQLDTETAWKQLNTATTTTAGLMAAADKVKLDALQQAATYINIATDFNTYKTAGSYFLKGAAHTNGPLTDRYAGTLVVVAPAELQYATQYFTQLYTNKTFVRTYSRDNSAWSAWNRVIVDTDLATTTVAGLMAAADKAALTGLTARGIYPNALAKSGAIDFNEVIDHGFYFIGGDTPHLNYPETYQQNGGTLQVIRIGNYLTQTFIPLNINKAFIRSCLNVLSDSSERTFSAWQRMLTGTDQYSQKVVALADFDDYRTPGEYFFYTAAHLNSPDAPNNTAGWLVIEIVSGGEHVKQTYYALNTRKTYIRTYNNRNQVWLPWLQQLSIADITESKARPGYFKLPGGMIVQWGAALNITADGTTSVTLPIAFPNSAFVATATASGSGLIASAAFDGNSKLNVIVKGYPGSGSFAVYWIAIGY